MNIKQNTFDNEKKANYGIKDRIEVSGREPIGGSQQGMNGYLDNCC